MLAYYKPKSTKQQFMKRPDLNEKISLEDFQSFYWLKKELIGFCGSLGIDQAGGKLEIAARITAFLQDGKITNNNKGSKKISKFDWQHSLLTLDTLITDNYKNTALVRLFFTKEIGSHFRVNVPFIKWLRTNVGKTLRDAIAEWHRIKIIEKDKNYKREIPPQFEYNRYIRDFLADNPDKSTKDAIYFWKLKRSKAGGNKYAKTDLQMELN